MNDSRLSTGFVIERAQSRDLPAAARFAAELVRQHHAVDPERFLLVDAIEPGYLAWFRGELQRAHAVILVAKPTGADSNAAEPLGYAYGALEGRDWNLLLDEHGAIHDLFVAERARRTGLGRALLERLVAELEGLGARRIVLSTMVSNTAAQRLFSAAGFRPTMLEMTRNR